jgi:cytochrome c oxidase subunit II
MFRRFLLLTISVAAVLLLGGCLHRTSALDPRGPAATDIAGHWWLMFWLGLSVYVVVISMLLFAIVRGRQRTSEVKRLPVRDHTFLTVAGLVIPAAILFALLVDSTRTGQAVLSPPQEPALVIEVTGHQFWWEIRYPDLDIVTANEINIPVGQPVELRLTSADVIHSFWTPQLAGKRDLNPGKENLTWIQADDPGVYFGQCAEFCGVQHALMAILVIAEPQDAFEQWVDERQQAATAEIPDGLATRGAEVFVEAGCVHCHAAGDLGEPGNGMPGPDLTHLGSRRSLASGIVDNTPENLSVFIANPHVIKPGVRMPATNLSGDDLDALIAFLLGEE